MPFFFIPLTTIALGAVEPQETASAAGVMSFLRTMAGAIGTSVSMTLYSDNMIVARSEMVARLNTDDTRSALAAQGFSIDQIRAAIELTVTRESSTLAINHLFLLSAIVFAFAALIIWLAPRPRRMAGPGEAH